MHTRFGGEPLAILHGIEPANCGHWHRRIGQARRPVPLPEAAILGIGHLIRPQPEWRDFHSMQGTLFVTTVLLPHPEFAAGNMDQIRYHFLGLFLRMGSGSSNENCSVHSFASTRSRMTRCLSP